MNRFELPFADAGVPWLKSTLALAVLLGCAPALRAQVQPSAGDVQRLVTPPLAPAPQPADTRPVVSGKDDKVPKDSTVPAFKVQGVVIKGASVFSQDILQALVVELLGKTASVADLRAAARKITEHYWAAGYSVARCVLPQQDIHDGVVEFLVLEGKLGAVVVENRSLLKPSAVDRFLGDVKAGTVLHEPTLERQLLILGDTPGVGRANAVLKPGKQTGETDVAVSIEPGPRYSGQIDADNHGNRYTGYQRLSGLFNLNSPLGLGDLLQARLLLTDEQLVNARVSYQLPVGGQGWQVGAAWSNMHYDLGREFASLKAFGWAEVVSLYAKVPLIRTVEHNLVSTWSLDHKTFADYQASVPGEPDRRTVDALSWTLNGYGTWRDASYAWASVFNYGHAGLDTATALAKDVNAQTQGIFAKWTATGNATWALGGRWSVNGAVYGQLASKNLSPSEKIALGGPAGVRAYPQAEATGDEGYIVSGEIRYNLPLQSLQLATFVDVGGVRINNNPFAAGSNERYLRGAGLSASWFPKPNLGFKLMLATPLGHEQVLSERVNHDPRIWLQLVNRF
jgi:hemolysin activation/secretion protein